MDILKVLGRMMEEVKKSAKSKVDIRIQKDEGVEEGHKISIVGDKVAVLASSEILLKKVLYACSEEDKEFALELLQMMTENVKKSVRRW